MQMRQIYILISICLTILWFNEISYSKADPYPNIEIPIMDGAYKVKKFIKNRAEYPACQGGDQSPRAGGTKNMI